MHERKKYKAEDERVMNIGEFTVDLSISLQLIVKISIHLK
jgi:hypothetical protein